MLFRRLWDGTLHYEGTIREYRQSVSGHHTSYLVWSPWAGAEWLHFPWYYFGPRSSQWFLVCPD